MTTVVVRHPQVNTSILGAHITAFDPISRQFQSAVRNLLISKGHDQVMASKMTYTMIFGMIQRQAWVLSFNEVVHLLGILFFLMIPFILLMRKPSQAAGSMTMHLLDSRQRDSFISPHNPS